jgi:hypothetical protein
MSTTQAHTFFLSKQKKWKIHKVNFSNSMISKCTPKISKTSQIYTRKNPNYLPPLLPSPPPPQKGRETKFVR